MFQPLPDINLLPEYDRRRSSGIILPLLFILLVLGAFVATGGLYFKWTKDLEQLTQQEKTVTDSVTVLTAQLDKLNQGELSAREESIAFIDGHDIPTSIFIKELYQLLPEHAYLSTYAYGNLQSRVTTQFESLDYVASYLSKLEHSDYINDAKINNVSTFELKEDEDSLLSEFDLFSRYQANFTIDVHALNLKGAAIADE